MMRLIYSTDLRGGCPRPFRRGKKGTYYIRQRIGGRDKWASLHTTDKREAEYLSMQIWRTLQSSTVKSMIPMPPMPISSVWERYSKTERFETLSESTKTTKRTIWKAFISDCNDKRIRFTTDLTAERALAYLESVGTKNKTFNNVLGDLRTAFSVLDENPFAGIKPKPIRRGKEEKVSKRINAFSDADAARILDAIRTSSRMKNADERIDLCTIMDNTGLRYKDAALLRHDAQQIIDGKACLVLSPHKTATATGGKKVIIRINPAVAQILLNRSGNGEYVLPAVAEEYEKKGNNASAWLDNLFHRLGIDSSSHGYRVRVVTKAAMAGIDLGDFGGVVGHTTEAQTKAYNRAAVEIDMAAVSAVSL